MLEPNIFTDSGGYEYLMGYGYCNCYVWYVSWQPRQEWAGRCGRCGEGARLLPYGWTREQAEARYKDEYGRKPIPFGVIR